MGRIGSGRSECCRDRVVRSRVEWEAVTSVRGKVSNVNLSEICGMVNVAYFLILCCNAADQEEGKRNGQFHFAETGTTTEFEM